MAQNRKKQSKRGFTMVELMAVLVILGLLMAMVVKNFVSQVDRGKVITTKNSLKQLHTAISQFRMENNRWPTEDEGLSVLVQQPADARNYPPGGYLDTTEVPTDAWGNDFIFELNPESGKPFVIKSLGADGQEGGEGYDADLLSTDP